MCPHINSDARSRDRGGVTGWYDSVPVSEVTVGHLRTGGGVELSPVFT